MQAQALDVYVLDVEGGKSVLLVSPSGESLLFDAGWPGYNGRDSDRIVQAAHAAGIKQIDYLVISHYDVDHLGDVPLLASKIPIRHFVDHGPIQTTRSDFAPRYDPYAALRDKSDHMAVKPGDRIPIKGVDVMVITAATRVLDKPLPGAGASNPLCASTPEKPERTVDLEDNMSIGLLFTLGKFRMLDMADLEWFYDRKLMCPNNPIGTVDVFVTSNHGLRIANSETLVHGLRPRVAIMNNGIRKGGEPALMKNLLTSPGLENLWEVHFSLLSGQEYTVPGLFIANILDDPMTTMPIAPLPPPADLYVLREPRSLPPPPHNGKAYWIKISAQSDGTFSVTNQRNGFTKVYPARSKMR